MSVVLAADTLPDAQPLANVDHVYENNPVWAVVDEAAPSIKLRFLFAGEYQIYRREYGGTDWGEPLVDSTGAAASEWTDTDISTGVIYEYALKRLDLAGLPAFGYITAGIRVDRANSRGTLILPIASNVLVDAGPEIRTLIEDLVGDGWKVEPIVTEAFTHNSYTHELRKNGLHGHNEPWALRNRIRQRYLEKPDEVKMVYLLGHVPLPQTGTAVSHPDGHGSRRSYVSDFFYADMDGRWSDQDEAPTWTIQGVPNVRGDGIFDQSTMPSPLELAFGRVDPVDITRGGGASVDGGSHGATLAKYLKKAHHYRHAEPYGKAGSEAMPGRRAIMRDGGGGQTGAVATAVDFMAIFGPDLVDDYHTNKDDHTFLTNNGPYLYYGQDTQGASGTGDGEKAVHRFGMQSWWGDWWEHNRSRVDLFSDTNMTLTWLYTGRFDGQFLLHPLGLGETFGQALKLSANFERDEYLTGANSVVSWERREFLRNLVGDPALRLFTVPPVQNLVATPSGSQVDLSWEAPADTSELVEYRISRADSLLGDFTRIATGITQTSFTDVGAPAGPKVYMVQAVHLVKTGSGSFLNNAQGVFATLGLSVEPLVLPPFPVGEDADFTFEVIGASGDPQWSIAEGKLPPGMQLLAKGALRGNPIIPGEYPVTFQIVDNSGARVRLNYSIFVDGAASEIVHMDLRSTGLGAVDKTEFDHQITVWGDPESTPEGTILDGDGDAFQLHHIGNGSAYGNGHTVFPNYNDRFAFVLSFKAEPESTGGMLMAQAQDLGKEVHYALYLTETGSLTIQNFQYSAGSADGFNDGQWHQVAMVENKLYIDGEYVQTRNASRNKDIPEDILIGARWDGAGGTAITDEFDGMIADFQLFRTTPSDAEIKALYQRMSRSRGDVAPHAPVISGLPQTVAADRRTVAFSALDPDGEPLRFELETSDPNAFAFMDVVESANGYELRFDTLAGFTGSASIMIAVDDGWPEHTEVHTITVQDNQTDPEAPGAPTNLTTGTITETSVELAWTAPTDNVGVTQYRVYVDGKVVMTSADASATVQGLIPGTSYSFTVSAFDAAGNESPQSAPISAATVPDTEAPTAPDAPGVSNETIDSVDLAWPPASDNTGVTGYRVYLDGALHTLVPTATPTIRGLDPETTYSITVTAMDVVGNESTPSPPVIATTVDDTEPPTAPAGLTTRDITSSTVDLTWDPATDNVAVSKYRVYVDGIFHATVSTTSATVTGLDVQTAYAFSVTAVDSSGNESPESAATNATTVDDLPPSEPADVETSNVTFSSVDLSWAASTDNVGVTGYKVYINGVASSDVSTTSATITGLDPETTYTFTVTALDAIGNESPESNPPNLITTEEAPPDEEAPTIPTGLSADNITATSVDLAWTASTDNIGVAGYHVFVDGAFALNVTTTSASVSGLEPETSYAFTVSAVDLVGNESAPSSEVLATTPILDIDAPTTPMDLAASNITPYSVDLTWSASSDNVGVTEYSIYIDGVFEATVATTSATLAGLTPETAYAFTVGAVDAAGNESAQSTAVNATTLEVDPLPPSTTLIGFSFSNADLVPEILDSNLTLENTATNDTADLSSPGTLRINKAGSNMEFRFDVVIAEGHKMNITGLFVGNEGQKRANNRMASLHYDAGQGLIVLPSTTHEPQDLDLGSGTTDFSADQIDLRGLTGTVTFVYAATPHPTNADWILFDDLNLIGSVVATSGQGGGTEIPVLRIRDLFIDPQTQGIELQWHGRNGVRYQIETSSDLIHWSPVPDFPAIDGEDAVEQHTLEFQAPLQFYRLKYNDIDGN